MRGQALTAQERTRLAAFVHERRAELVAAVVASAEPSEPAGRARHPFAKAFLARLCLELRHDDPGPIERLTDSTNARNDAAAGQLASHAFGVISRAYAATYSDASEATAYLARRSAELEKRSRHGRTKDRAVGTGLDASTHDVVTSFLSALDARDGSACDHCRAVGMWSGRLAKSLGLGAGDQAAAVLAGTLIDVGKIATPTELLLKPGALTVDEREVMCSHAPIGAKMLERVPSLRRYAPIVRAHHERFDGEGYPDRLAGSEIPVIARVLAVADAFHAMISKRPYRAPIPVGVAARELKRYAGTQWDPEVVDAMLAIVEPAVRAEALPDAPAASVAF